MSYFLYLDFRKTVKSKRRLAAGEIYGRLTPAHEGAAWLSPFRLDCFSEIQTEKIDLRATLKIERFAKS